MAKRRKKPAAKRSRPAKRRVASKRRVSPKPRKTVVRRRRAAPRPVTPVRAKGQPELRLEEKVRYKDRAGRFVARGAKGARRHVYVYQVSRRGNIIRTIEQESPHVILKTVVPSRLGDFENEDSKYMGHIFTALIDSSVTSRLHRPGVKRVAILIRWKDERDKAFRERIEINMEEVRKRKQFPAALVGLILEALRDRGFRTNYTVQLFKAARAKGLKYPITWEAWRKLRVTRQLEITVIIYT